MTFLNNVSDDSQRQKDSLTIITKKNVYYNTRHSQTSVIHFLLVPLMLEQLQLTVLADGAHKYSWDMEQGHIMDLHLPRSGE